MCTCSRMYLLISVWVWIDISVYRSISLCIVTPVDWPCHTEPLPALIWFHLNNSQVKTKWSPSLWPCTTEPWGTSSYQGVKVDRSLTFHHHLDCLKMLLSVPPSSKALWYFMGCTSRCPLYVDDGTCPCTSRMLGESLALKSFLGETLLVLSSTIVLTRATELLSLPSATV